MEVDLKGFKSKINPAYYPLFSKSNIFRYNVCWGGTGSGKTFVYFLLMLWRMMKEGGHQFVVFRKTLSSHSGTTYETLKAAIEFLGLSEYAVFLSKPMEIRFPIFNTKFVFMGVDDPEKLKGLVATSILIDEITELDPADFAEIEDRLRSKKRFNQIYITFNPVSEYHWIKGRFFDRVDHRALIIKTTYLDNLKNLPASAIEQREMQKITDPARYRVYTLGEWGVVDKDNLYYHQFDDQVHVAKEAFELNRNLGVMISCDFNVTPFISGLIIQVDGNTVYIQDELALKSPRNNSEDLAYEFAKRLDWYDDQITVFGDATGRNRSSLVREGVNHFTIIASVLQNAGKRTKISIEDKNPSLALRQLFMNNSLASTNGIKVIISPKCLNLIADLLNQKMTTDSKGMVGISKQTVRVGNESYEKYGHMGDAFSYFLMRHFSVMVNKMKNGNNVTKIQSAVLPVSDNFY